MEYCNFVETKIHKMSIANNIEKIQNTLPSTTTLVAVSKTKPNSDIIEAFNAGQIIFGENKVQDLVAKYEVLPKDIEWHFIGHLQSNKIKYLAPFVSLIHGVDSYKLLKAINKEAVKNHRTINCLLQVHIAEEDTKFGFSVNEITELLESGNINELSNIKICGLMGMATNTKDELQVRKEFCSLRDTFNNFKQTYFSNNEHFKEISMGMSGDYQIAIECGSTMIRVGSSIFGAR